MRQPAITDVDRDARQQLSRRSTPAACPENRKKDEPGACQVHPLRSFFGEPALFLLQRLWWLDQNPSFHVQRMGDALDV